MMLSRRERWIALIAAAAIAVLALDRYVLSPLLERRRQLVDDKQLLLNELERAQATFVQRRRTDRRWAQMRIATGAEAAERQVLHALRSWSQEAGLNTASVRPRRGNERGELRSIGFSASATGPMSAVARFLYEVERAEQPLRIEQLQLAARGDEEDELKLDVEITTLYRSDAPAAAERERER